MSRPHQKDNKPERTGWEKIKYDTVKYAAFLAPPTILFLFWFAITGNVISAVITTVVTILVFIVGFAYWYYTNRGGAVETQ